jgi:hypothetical protein
MTAKAEKLHLVPLRPWRLRVSGSGTILVDDASGELVFETDNRSAAEYIVTLANKFGHLPIAGETV